VFWLTVLFTACALLAAVAVAFVIGSSTGKHSVMDTAWGASIAVAGLVSFLVSIGHGVPARRWPLAAAAVLWGVRLALHVAVRARGKGEDPRYDELLRRAPGNRNWYALRVVYVPQLLILWLACLPLTAGMTAPAPAGAITVVGGALWLIGFFFEVVGDWQLTRFRADPANRGGVLNSGLWHYTRHPNYFGDACMWWGLFALSYGSAIQLVTLVSPLLMTYILTKGTGQRLTDRRMADGGRPGYAEYVARTSGFIPLPPRRRPR
jgi:steroid 5-alpha reductase family enzyme